MIRVDEANTVSTPPVTPPAAMMPDAPKLLVEWSSPWAEFRTAIGPAFTKSSRKLAGEARAGLFPYRGILFSWVMEALVLVALVVIPAKLRVLSPFQPPTQPKYEVIYYSGDELPRVEDAGGAQTGRSGRAGGREAFHRTQTIRVARGGSLREQVVDAPNVKLPVSNQAVANLLAYKPIPGPPPAEGLKSSLRAANAPAMQVVAPAPTVQSSMLRSAPSLNAPQQVVAPSPAVQAQALRSAPAMNATVVAPSPSAPRRDLAAMQVPGSRAVQVVAPPVSAPERELSGLNPRLTLPAQTVVAPPPTEIPRQLSPRGPGFGAGELQRQVVPPTVQLSNGSVRNGTGMALNGNVAVAPPTVQLSTGGVRNGRGTALSGSVAVAPPTVQISNAATSRLGAGTMGGSAAVVAPPVQMSGGALSRSSGTSLGGNVAVAAPSPSLAGTGALSANGQGVRGSGFGGRGDSGDVMAPPKGGGSGNGNGIVVSSKPGSQVGLPGGGGAGSLAMSPKGGDQPGLGGAGGGSSIGHGDGPGSGFSGPGSGAGKDGPGRGSDPNARAGISPYPGPGGSGSGVNGTPAMAGVSVRGGSNNVVTLPSFGESGDAPTDLSRSTGKDRNSSGVTVVATSRSGGAFNRYGYLKGDKVYTIYLDTTVGPAVMQLADPLSATRASAQELTAPAPIRTDLPAGILHSRLVIACTLDRTGILKSFQVLEPGDATMTAKVLAALPRWKFRSAMRGDQPVDVTVILGFNVDTSDRY
jgi:hypothetical protein